MKLQVFYAAVLVCAEAFILSCAGSFGGKAEPAGGHGGSLKSPAQESAVTASTYQAVPRTDPNSMTAHAQLLEKTKKGRIDVYFAGNSITRRWGATDYPDFLAHWTRHFFGWNAADFGWGGDGLQNILWRLQNGELDGVHPKVIVLLAGTNDVGNAAPNGVDEVKTARITDGFKAVLETMRTKAPEAVIVVMGIFPRNDNMAVMPVINKINDNLSRLADGRKIRYLNINDRLADGGGRLFAGMTVDGLHPSLKGYEVWAEALKPIFAELLGPPGDVDYGPPPTGDPKAGAAGAGPR
jgi:lysophospholipase L1-like esterase